MKKILVTGGAGFIGSHTVDLLLANDYRVIVIDNLKTGKLSYVNLFHPNIEFIQRDVLDYPKLVTEISRCEAVLHLAALPSVTRSIEDPIGSLKNNTQAFLYVLQAIREINRPIRLVYASSAAVYGNNENLPCLENTTSGEVLSPYALEKVNNEKYADLYSRLFGISSLGLRYFNVYGTRQDPKSSYSGVISKFMHQYQKRHEITVFGTGDQSRDFIYVEDVARANLAALQSDYTGIINIATGIPQTLKNLVRCIETVGGYPAKMDFYKARQGDIQQSYGCTEKAKKNIGFEFQVSLATGINKIFSAEKR